MPPIVEAYIEYLQSPLNAEPKGHVDFQSAVCILLYTLCKVRGSNVIVGFLNNEPRYLEPVLDRLEDVLTTGEDIQAAWQVPYVLLLWLSHLLLTPFDLASISDRPGSTDGIDGIELPADLPPAVTRILYVGLKYLPASTKAQDAASKLLVRLVTRPDMQKLQLAGAIVSSALLLFQDGSADVSVTIYERLGPLRFLAGIAASVEVPYLVPDIYRTCVRLSEDDKSSVASNAVAKKLMVKILRNTATLSLRSKATQGPLSSFLETTSVLEDVIDHLLRSLGDRDTPVRYAAAKAISLVILELDSGMGHEVIQAILDAFKEDMLQHSERFDFRSVNALKWHGLTLALAHTLFKRSASPEQLPNIFNALVLALQFEQRTATGSSLGTNVRDAANFGVWSLSRRYTTDELLSVDTSAIRELGFASKQGSVIQSLATELIISACLDPAGNIRRGSSAALQELIGRHPNQVRHGIELVQIVDYQTVGLRRRAMVDVVSRAAQLHRQYWSALRNGLLAWRGLGSADVPSREAAAASLAQLATLDSDAGVVVLAIVLNLLQVTPENELEMLHGLVLSLACLLEALVQLAGLHIPGKPQHRSCITFEPLTALGVLLISMRDFTPRLLRSELPSATARFLAALCQLRLTVDPDERIFLESHFNTIDVLTEGLLARHEDTIKQNVPSLVRSLLVVKHKAGVPLGSMGAQTLCKKVSADGSKSTLHGACRGIALGALAPMYGEGLSGEKALAAVESLTRLTSAMNVDWRIIAVKALQLAVEAVKEGDTVEYRILEFIVNAVHQTLNDYTIDERGDVGSLVRLQAIACTTCIFARDTLRKQTGTVQILEADILRLSLEKLDRVRLAAAQCRSLYLGFKVNPTDVGSISSDEYFSEALAPLGSEEAAWMQTALLQGCISCAGISAEPLLQAARSALVQLLNKTTTEQLVNLMSLFSSILKSMLIESGSMQQALELLAFVFDMQILQRLADSDFKWRNLLSTVQKSHHKSNDIPKILAAVHVYRGLVDIPPIRDEVLKKLVSMLKTNPYPRVRLGVAETLSTVIADPRLKERNWTESASWNKDLIGQLEERYVKS